MTKVLGIIPARYDSSRFPGKPLTNIAGKSMIRRVYEQASKAPGLDLLTVATDDVRIAAHVDAFGGDVVLTSDRHQSGTDRCGEVAEDIYPDFDIIINIQGDEPFVDPAQIELVVACFKASATQIATLIKKIDSAEELFNINTPKVVINWRKEAIYFSRATIPYQRNAPEHEWLNNHTYYKHIGIYGYRTDVLRELTQQLPYSTLEKTESLEQLRWIDNGYRIQTAETTLDTHAIDLPEDVAKVLKSVGKKR